jgi:hypothetical protein
MGGVSVIKHSCLGFLIHGKICLTLFPDFISMSGKCLSRVWHINSSPFLFKKWTPLFDASRERVDVLTVWVQLPGLPRELWMEDVFKIFGNRLGTFMEADMSFIHSQNQGIARILVSLNLREGLEKEIDIV